jgi:hypothetical protein
MQVDTMDLVNVKILKEQKTFLLLDILTPNLSFGHNLWCKYSNGSYKPILDIYVLRTFQWYKEALNPMSFGPSNRSLKI